ncbi:MAG: galactosyldiacylglycerol synthase, partial [Candidatus Omnitrophica bacterium]|nr:galactosyldiacylglycerol synthase [Candidatus Omnitrophota bacterium]
PKNLEKLKKAIHMLNSPKLKNLFDRFQPDIVACSQAFPCGMVADYKKTYQSNLPLIAVLTDFVPHDYWIYDTINAYVVPSQEIGDRLVQKGIPQEKIKPFGIPFDPKFNIPVAKEPVLASLGLAENATTILIMGGGQGLGPIQTILDSLNLVSGNVQYIIITGTNKKLFNVLQKKVKTFPRKTALLPFASNVNELMAAADIIITKPGGITTAEALTKHLPMIIVQPIPGQEENNTRFLTQKKAALRVEDPSTIHEAIEQLLRDPQQLNTMRACAAAISKPHASHDIAKLLLGTCCV